MTKEGRNHKKITILAMSFFIIYLFVEITSNEINILRFFIVTSLIFLLIFYLLRETKNNIKSLKEKEGKLLNERQRIKEEEDEIKENISSFIEFKKEVQANIEYYKIILDNLSDYVFIMNEEDKIVYSNMPFKKFTNNKTENIEKCNFKLDFKKHISANKSLYKNKVEEIELSENDILYKKVRINIQGHIYILSIGYDQSDLAEVNKNLLGTIKELQKMDKDINKNNLRLNSLLDFMNSLEDLNKLELKSFLIKVFDYTFKLLDVADYGATYMIDDGLIKYLDAKGHNIDKLKNITIFKDNFFYERTPEPLIIKDILTKTKEYYHDQINVASMPIKESLSFSIIIDKEPVGVISLDIKKGSENYFSDDDIEIMSNISKLVNIIVTLVDNREKNIKYTNDVLSSFLTLMKLHKKTLLEHSKNVANLSRDFSKFLRYSDSQIKETYWTGLMHDVGFLLEEPEIFEGELGFKEKLNFHVITAYNIMKKIDGLKDVAFNIYNHHEKYDGSGYPNGVKGENIPDIAQIVNISNYYDTLTVLSDKTKNEFIDLLKKESGTSFKPELVDKFIEFINEKSD